MFSSDKHIEHIKGLVQEVKHYLELQKEYAKLTAAEKGTVLASTLIIAIVCVILGGIVLLLALFALAFYLGNVLHSLPAGFGITAGAGGLVFLLFYCNRNRWVTLPIARFMTRLFLTGKDDNTP